MNTKPHRLKSDPEKGDRKTIEPELKRQDKDREEETEPTEQGVELDPKRRID